MTQPPSVIELSKKIEQALGEIGDPCMCLAGKDLSIIDMGLINEVELDGSAVRVSMTLTDPNCFFEYKISNAVIESLKKLDGVSDVKVAIESFPIWDNDRLSDRAKSKFKEDSDGILALRQAS
jgi:metal-sulfur cluster biosynthetic enzyme